MVATLILTEIADAKNPTIVFPAPLMSAIQGLGAFRLKRETVAAGNLNRPIQLRGTPSGKSTRQT